MRPRRLRFPSIGAALAAVAASACSPHPGTSVPPDASRARTAAARLVRDVESAQWHGVGAARGLLQIGFARTVEPGLYPSGITVSHFFVGRHADAVWARRLAEFAQLRDTNMFATATVAQCLLDSAAAVDVSVDGNRLAAAVRAILRHRDRSLGDGVPAYCFYRQVQRTDGSWVQFPANVHIVAGQMAAAGPVIYAAAEAIRPGSGRHPWFAAPDLRALAVEGDPSGFLNRFNMPADADDSGLALTLGLSLERNRHRFPAAAAAWDASNHAIGRLADELTRHAWRPGGRDEATNIIDPRTYFWSRDFVRGREPGGPVLLTTWMQHVYEGRQFGDRTTKMPLNMNNVEPVVCANALGGLTAAMLAGQLPAEPTGDLRDLYRDTADLLAWALATGIADSAPDTAMLYYPTPEALYWSAGRLLARLEDAAAAGQTLGPLLAGTRDRLASVLRGPGTAWLLDRAACENGRCRWPGVLDGGRDELYVTAVAVNALVDIWSVASEPGRRWLDGVPAPVVATTAAAVSDILAAVTTPGTSFANACFSGSARGVSTLPFFFPMNTRELHGDLAVVGVRGTIPEALYRDELKRCRSRAPGGRLGVRSTTFTHWSSTAVTRAVAARALATWSAVTAQPTNL